MLCNCTKPTHCKCLMIFPCAKCFQGLTTQHGWLHWYLCKCVRWSTKLQMQLLALALLLLKLPKFPTAWIILLLNRYQILVCQQGLNWTWLFYFTVNEFSVSSAWNIFGQRFLLDFLPMQQILMIDWWSQQQLHINLERDNEKLN